MKRLPLFLFALVFVGCPSSFEGIKIRAQAPSISEASRRIGLAFRADDYAIESGSALGLYHVTHWRGLKDPEKGEIEKDATGKTESKVSVRLEPRGTNYDIVLTVTLRNPESEDHPEPGHPIVVKWEKILRQIVTLEAKEE
jgi:hypothetical protein